MKQQTVLLGLSGGVDSAVAAILLKKQGYNVIGAFMRNFSDTKNKLTGDCSWVTEKKDAQKVAALLKIPLITLNFEKEYKNRVISPMFDDYARGLTPNPDSLCNKVIKFPLLWKAAKKHNADFIATGHYIKKTEKNGKYSVQIPKDTQKDQSYFLYDLTQFDLKHTLFPIGQANLTKKEVRTIAKKHNIPVHNKRGTRGICFVGKIDMKTFLKQKIKEKQGPIKNPEGDIVGTHNGIMFYTIGERLGERHGIQLDNAYKNKIGEKLYVIDKKPRSNTLIVASKNHTATKKNTFTITKTNWITQEPQFPLKDITVRMRHTGDRLKATLAKKGNKFHCTLKKPIGGIAAGQSCVIYRGNTILGGGEIRNA